MYSGLFCLAHTIYIKFHMQNCIFTASSICNIQIFSSFPLSIYCIFLSPAGLNASKKLQGSMATATFALAIYKSVTKFSLNILNQPAQHMFAWVLVLIS